MDKHTVQIQIEVVDKPWGYYEVLRRENNYVVKRIVVLGGKRLSLQRHKKREEWWTIVKGYSEITRAPLNTLGSEIKIGKGGHFHIPKNSWHRIKNLRREELLVFIEVQFGECSENDIERKEDDYGRC